MTGPCSAHHIAFADCPACQAAVPADLRVCQFCGSRAAVTAMTYHRTACERDTLRAELAAAQARIAVLEAGIRLYRTWVSEGSLLYGGGDYPGAVIAVERWEEAHGKDVVG